MRSREENVSRRENTLKARDEWMAKRESEFRIQQRALENNLAVPRWPTSLLTVTPSAEDGRGGGGSGGSSAASGSRGVQDLAEQVVQAQTDWAIRPNQAIGMATVRFRVASPPASPCLSFSCSLCAPLGLCVTFLSATRIHARKHTHAQTSKHVVTLQMPGSHPRSRTLHARSLNNKSCYSEQGKGRTGAKEAAQRDYKAILSTTDTSDPQQEREAAKASRRKEITSALSGMIPGFKKKSSKAAKAPAAGFFDMNTI